MDPDFFVNALQKADIELRKLELNRAFNSIGSNIFLEFGRIIEINVRRGKEFPRREWIIWISDASWKITKHGEYLIGSGDDPEIKLNVYLEKLLGNRLSSLHVLSQYLDVQFDFEDGYQLTTFFNWIGERQWILFLPDKTEIVIDCSTEQSIESVQHLSSQIEIKNKYKNLEFPFVGAEVKELLFAENELSKIIFTKGFLIDIGLSAWRLAQNDQYQMGRKDYYFGSMEGQSKELEDKLLNLIGKKIKRMSIDSSGMDVRLEFEGGYVLEIFTHAQTDPWKISNKEDLLLCANVGI